MPPTANQQLASRLIAFTLVTIVSLIFILNAMESLPKANLEFLRPERTRHTILAIIWFSALIYTLTISALLFGMLRAKSKLQERIECLENKLKNLDEQGKL